MMHSANTSGNNFAKIRRVTYLIVFVGYSLAVVWPSVLSGGNPPTIAERFERALTNPAAVKVAKSRYHPPVSAIEHLLQKRFPKHPKRWIRSLSSHFLALCQKYGFRPDLILGLIRVESNFEPKVISYAGAIGLMQVMPRTGKTTAKKLKIRWRGRRTLRNPWSNMRIGFHYLNELRDKFQYRKRYLTAYNWGPGHVAMRIRRRKKLNLDYYHKVEKYRKNYAYLNQPSKL